MGVHLGVADHDAKFRSSPTKPLIVNDLDISSSAAKTEFNKLISTRYEGDTLSILPQCDCGFLKGEPRLGKICKKCNHPVAHVSEREIEPSVWLEAPKGVTAMINPIMWIVFKENFTWSGTNLIEWLCNPSYVSTSANQKQLNKLKSFGFERGLNNFIKNFDTIIDTLFNNKLCNVNNVIGRQAVYQMIKEHREKIFPKHLPIPSKIAFITEDTVAGTYADPTMAPAIDAIRTISSINTSIKPLTTKQLENRTLKAVSQLSKYYTSMFSESLGKKEGWFRKHVFGSRLHFSFRGVITSLSRPHNYREIEIPWSIAAVTLRTHCLNKLFARGFTPRQAYDFMAKHARIYHPLLDDIFQELINEGIMDMGDGRSGIPILLNRNPSLVRGSIQLFGITKVKTDVDDLTISLSTLVLTAYNADFDGDALNAIVILDRRMLKKFERLAPHTNVMDLQKPYTVSDNVKIHSPVIGTIESWLAEGRDKETGLTDI